ncbi:MAG: pilus assembly protein, partial [Chloroflexi bacterium]|nr:pilus assembly protein [Chloroflexota bacterium]
MFTKFKRRERDEGQGILEFALVLPILLLLLFGVIEAGRLFFIYTATAAASREGARYGATVGEVSPGVPRYLDCTGIEDAVIRAGNMAAIDRNNIVIVYDGGFDSGIPNPSDPTPTPYSDCPTTENSVSLGDRIVVDVITEYEPLVPIVNIDPMDIRAITARSIYKDILLATAEPPPTSTPTTTSTATATATSTATITPTPTSTP